jgi:endoglucanase
MKGIDMLRTSLVAITALLVTTAALGADKSLSAADQVAQMKRGVNVVGYDPLWRDASHARFKPKHFKIIADGGFDHVRFNLYAFRRMDPALHLDPAWLDTLDALVKQALDQHLQVVLDLHDYEKCADDTARCRNQVLAFWSQVAEHYRKSPPAVMFEILNEPNGKLDAEWNSLLAEALAVIRKTNPTRNVVIGPAFWNNIGWLSRLELPKHDRHIIVTVHYYLPMRFTHQGARWAPEYTNVSGVSWGTPEERAALARDFDGVQAWAKANDRPILLGEFGAYDKGPLDSRVAYTAAVARAAEQRGWAWSYWQFDSNFVVYLIDEERWNEPIYRALVPAP